VAEHPGTGDVETGDSAGLVAGGGPLTGQDAGDLADIAVEAARRAGALLTGGHATNVETKSSATDMVSEMDRAAEALIRAVITGRRPGDAILGEEGGEAAGGSGVRWIVDPLDGTTNFLYRFPAWCVSVAAEVNGVVSVAAVYDPTHEELWTAVRGAGAACNEVPLRPLEDRGGLGTALVATGFGYRATERGVQGRVAAYVLPRVRDLRRAGSAALDLCWLADGRVDAYFEQGTNLWDWAGGALVASEAGAWVGGFDGGPPSSEGIVAARPALAAELRGLLRRASARR
jgi:myo-inositol-1(or 4)-monophosphatase